MIPRKRYGSKNTDQGVYLGLSKTQVLSPATAGSSSSDIAPLPPPVALVPPPPDTMSCRDRTQEFLSAMVRNLSFVLRTLGNPSRIACRAMAQSGSYHCPKETRVGGGQK